MNVEARQDCLVECSVDEHGDGKVSMGLVGLGSEAAI